MTKLDTKVAVVNPLISQHWNEMLLNCDGANIFHSSNWARLLIDSYGYHPRYFTVSEQGRFKGCLPVMEVNSMLTGRRGVCLSFSDYCGALLQEPEDFPRLFDRIIEFGRKNGWRYVEFRGEGFLNGELPAKVFVHHSLDLINDERQMHTRLRESTARNIRRSEKEGVTVRICRSLKGVKDFYRLHCLTRRRHGIPPQSIGFFEMLHKYVISMGFGFTVLASKGEVTVAGVICLHFGNNAVYKYGASDDRYQHLRPNNLVLWEAIKKCAREGFRSFSLGRTDLDNEGLLAFKNGWGGAKSILNYYKYDFATNNFICAPEQDLEVYRKVLRQLPIGVLRVLGKMAYRHMG